MCVVVFVLFGTLTDEYTYSIVVELILSIYRLYRYQMAGKFEMKPR